MELMPVPGYISVIHALKNQIIEGTFAHARGHELISIENGANGSSVGDAPIGKEMGNIEARLHQVGDPGERVIHVTIAEGT